jgi:hypothetical protein
MGENILGIRNFMDYGVGKDIPTNGTAWLGWSLAQLNPFLVNQRGLLQRATQLVTNFILEGCLSRVRRKTARHREMGRVCLSSQSQRSRSYMIPPPVWLPGLDSDPKIMKAMQAIHQDLKVKYHQLCSDGFGATDASKEVVSCY